MENKDKIIVGSLIGLAVIAAGAILCYLIANKKDEEKEDLQKLPNIEPPKKPIKQASIIESTPTSPTKAENKPVVKPIKETPDEVLDTADPTQQAIESKTADVNQKKVEICQPVADEFPLRLGSKGRKVERLKVWMQKNFGTFGIINDEFDGELEAMVLKRFKQPFVTRQDFESKQMELPVHHQPT